MVVGAVPDVLDGESEKSWVPGWGQHLNHVGVSLHHQIRAICRDLCVNVPAETGYTGRRAIQATSSVVFILPLLYYLS
jgi:hypothetical protein